MMIKSGAIDRAVSSTCSPSATGSTSKPFAFNTSQNNFRLRSLSSTTIIRFVTECPDVYDQRFPATNTCLPLTNSRHEQIRGHPISDFTDSSPGSSDRPASQEAATRAATLALAAIGWVLQDEERAERYLDLTGLDPDSLRAGLGDPQVLGSALDFLANYEPDLIRAAEALAVTPEELVAARKDLTA